MPLHSILHWLRRDPRFSTPRKFLVRLTRRLSLEALEERIAPSVTPEVEPNNTLLQATVLPITEDPAGSGFFTGYGSGSISAAGDVDYWTVNLKAGDRITVSAAQLGSSQGLPFGETTVLPAELRTPGNVLLGKRGDFTSPDGTLSGDLAATDGLYSIMVPAPTGASTATYRLRVNVSRGIFAEQEANNTWVGSGTRINLGATSVPLTVNGPVQTVSGWMASSSDLDYFKIGFLPVGTVIHAAIRRPSDSVVAPYLFVSNFDNNGTYFQYFDTDSFEYTTTRALTSFVSVAADPGGGSQGAYLLDLWATTSPAATVTSTSLPDSNTTVAAVYNSFTLGFTSAMSSASLSSSSHYDLRAAGGDNQFDTNDDEIYAVTLGSLSTDSKTATLRLTDGPLQPGSYRLTVTGLTDQSGATMSAPFVRTFSIANFTDGTTLESRSNDTQATATPLQMTEGPTGVFMGAGRGVASVGDTDYFSFNAAAGDSLILTATTSPYTLFAPSGATLAQIDPTTSQTTVSLTQSGTYAVRISGASDNDYLFRILRIAAPLMPEREPNESVATATALTLTGPDSDHRSGSAAGLAILGEHDYFDLGQLNADQGVILTGRSPNSYLDATLDIVDASNHSVAIIGTGSYVSHTTKARIPQAGHYYAVFNAPTKGPNFWPYTFDISIAPSVPDLIISSAHVFTPTAVSGQSATFEYTVDNVGTAALPSSSIWWNQLILSLDSIPGNGDDVRLGDPHLNVGPLAASVEFDNGAMLYTLPTTLQSGDYHVYVQVNATGSVTEDPSNNFTLAGMMHVDHPPSADLQVSTPTATFNADGSVALNWSEANNGNAAAGPFKDHVAAVDTRSGRTVWQKDYSVSGLGVGAGASYSETVLLPSGGPFRFTVTTDWANQVSEEVKSNNTASTDVTALLDLTVGNLRLDYPDVHGGDTVTVRWDTSLSGNQKIWDDFNETLTVRDAVTGADIVAPIPVALLGGISVGTPVSRFTTLTLPLDTVGFVIFSLTTDSSNQIGEYTADGLAESNNAAPPLTIATLHAPAPDLTIENIHLDGTTLSWDVANHGDQPVNGNFTNLVSLKTAIKGTPLITFPITYYAGVEGQAILPGQHGTQQYPFGFSLNLLAGDTGIVATITADSGHNVFEANENRTAETNNTTSQTLHLPAPDLDIENLHLEPQDPSTGLQSGGTLIVTWDEYNRGGVPVAGFWSDRVDVSNTTTNKALTSFGLGYSTSNSGNSPLQPGDHHTVRTPYQLPDGPTSVGDLSVTVTADSDNAVLEGNSTATGESNNTSPPATITSVLAPYPDLVVTNVTAPAKAYTGDQIEVTWTDSNTGSLAPPTDWEDFIYLAADTSQGPSYTQLGRFRFTDSLLPGQSATRKQVVKLPASPTGDLHLFVAAMSPFAATRPFYELDTSNNQSPPVALNVQPAPLPDLIVTDVTAPSTALSSQQALVKWQVKNVGTAATSVPTWKDSVWLSSDTILDASDVYLGAASNPAYLEVQDSYQNSLTVTLPDGLSGPFFFLVAADRIKAPGNQPGWVPGPVAEGAGEDNNVRPSSVTQLSLAPAPDLQLTRLTGPTGFFSGQPVQLNWVVTNIGATPTRSNSWTDAVYLSTDGSVNAGDQLLGTFPHQGGLAPGDSYASLQTVTLPIGVYGNYHLLVRTDDGDQVYEGSANGNNVKDLAASITLTPPPDLEVTAIDIPSSIRSGAPLTFRYTVVNNGATDTPNSSWTDGVYLLTDPHQDPTTGSRIAFPSHAGALAPGDAYTNTVTFTPDMRLQGSYYLLVVADNKQQVFELNRTNNMLPVSVTFAQSPPDLVVAAFTAPATAETGQFSHFSLTVANTGTGDSIVSSWVDNIYLSTDGKVAGATQLASIPHSGLLGVGQSYQVATDVLISESYSGNYYFVVQTAPQGGVPEANTDNNSSPPIAVAVTRNLADLAVVTVTAPQTALITEPLSVSWAVVNQGTGATSALSWYDDVYLSLDDKIGAGDVRVAHIQHQGRLPSQEFYNASATFGSLDSVLKSVFGKADGTYHVLVRSDSNHEVVDSDRTDNDLPAPGALTLQVPPSADLAVTGVLAPALAWSGQQLPLSWTVTNHGDSIVDGSWYDAVYLSRDRVFDKSTDVYLGYVGRGGNLAGGGSYTSSHNFNLPPGLSGTFYVLVAAGIQPGIIRFYDTNADSSLGVSDQPLPVSLIPPADLVAGTLTIPPTGIPGHPVTITYTVTNQGPTPARGQWYDALYLSADDQWDVGDAYLGRVVSPATDVPSGGSYSGTLTAPLPGVAPGSYHVILRSDIRNAIPEANETNNIKASLTAVALDVPALTLGTPASTKRFFVQRGLTFMGDGRRIT